MVIRTVSELLAASAAVLVDILKHAVTAAALQWEASNAWADKAQAQHGEPVKALSARTWDSAVWNVPSFVGVLGVCLGLEHGSLLRAVDVSGLFPQEI